MALRNGGGGPDARRGLPYLVLIMAGVAVVALLALSPLYGFHRDELYFIVAGRHPALGYVDQPPLTPLLSAGMVELLGLSPTAIRILPALVMGAIVLLAGLTARDLGGSRRAQVLAAVVTALSGYLAAGHAAFTATYDLLAWAFILWLAVRLLAGADPRLWLVVGVAAGIALQNKHIPLFLGAGLAGGLLLARRWDVFRSPWAWSALGLALLIWLPNLAWQAANGFPQLEMARSIAADSPEERLMVFVELILLAGPFLFPITVAGAWWLLAAEPARPWRALGWAAIVLLGLVLVIGGKSYYVAGILALLFAAGSIVLDGWLDRGRRRARAALFAVAATLSGVTIAVLVLPILPASSLAGTPIPDLYAESAEQVGWPEFVATVEGVWATLPEEDRAGAVIFTANYGEAGSLELLGRDLPAVHSGHNAYWDWGPPPDDATGTVVVGWGDGSFATRYFADCQLGATVDNRVGLENQEQGVQVWACGPPRRPWSEIWPELRHLN